MAYKIIKSDSRENLVTAVNDWITANPTYQPVGGPVLVSVSLAVQAVQETA